MDIRVNEWVPIEEFPDHSLNPEGEIINNISGDFRRPSRNQQGIVMVNFTNHYQQRVRSLAVLVAKTFLSREGVPDHFNTPIHLNGDKSDCRASNLAWRPRWFAVMYHKQFSFDHFMEPRFNIPIQLIETGEVFDNTWDAAMKYGMLEVDIAIGTANGTPVPLQYYHFDFLDR